MPSTVCTYFLRGACTKGSKCSFAHEPASATEAIAAKALHDFISARGGDLCGAQVSEFYQKHQRLKAVIGGNLREFCQKHSALLSFERDGKSGTISSKPASLKQGTTAPASYAETRMHALMLAGFVASNGGKMLASQLVKLYTEHPDLKEALSGKTRQFCEIHRDLLEISEQGGGPATITCASTAQQGAAASAASAGLSASSGNLDPRQAAGLLSAFVASRGGSMPANELGQFYASHPNAKAAVHGSCRAFCEKHVDLLLFETDAGCGRVRSVKPQNNKLALQPEYNRVALLWKDYLDDGKEHIIGTDRTTMKAEFLQFYPTIQTALKPASFGMVMAALNKLGFNRHGTWKTETSASAPAKKLLEGCHGSDAVPEERVLSAGQNSASKSARDGTSTAILSELYRRSSVLSASTSTSPHSGTKADPWQDSEDPWSLRPNAPVDTRATSSNGSAFSMKLSETCGVHFLPEVLQDNQGSNFLHTGVLPETDLSGGIQDPYPSQTHRGSSGFRLSGGIVSTVGAASGVSSILSSVKLALEQIERAATELQFVEEQLAAKQAVLSLIAAREEEAALREKELDAREAHLDSREQAIKASEAVMASLRSSIAVGLDQLAVLPPR
ncbi:unnamed protein product [Polarella glacialis]|uniref:C3H1-type domain-containing protein n=1 Tax=Polarella glacialis TaxID=89957 RepID=A0A813M0C4_POLGL|nr:unnamed protein product [Polarella glacialis]